MSRVAFRVCMAHECRSTWGVTRFPAIEGWVFAATRCVLGEDVGEAGSGHGMAVIVEEQFRFRCRRSDRDPRFQRRRRFLPKRQDPFASPFAHHMDAGPMALIDMVKTEADQFGDAQTGGKGDVQHGPIPRFLTWSRDRARRVALGSPRGRDARQEPRRSSSSGSRGFDVPGRGNPGVDIQGIGRRH